MQANRTPEAAAELPGGVSFTRPRDRNEETITQGTFVGGLTGPALRQVRKHAAIIAWMRSTMSPTSRVRLMQDAMRSKKSQTVGKATARAAKTRSGRQEKPAYPRALNRAEVGLVDASSESSASDAGGMPQLFRRPTAPSARSPKAPQIMLRRQTAAQESALKLTAAGGPQKKAREPTLLMKHGHKIRQEGATKTGAILRIAPRARKENKGGVRRNVAVRGAGEWPTAEVSESPRCGQPRGLGVNPDLVEVKSGGARAPVPNKPPEGNDEFA